MDGIRGAFSVVLIIHHSRGKTFLNTLTSALWIMFFSWAGGNGHHSQSCVKTRHCSLYSLQIILSSALGSFFTHTHWSVFCRTLSVGTCYRSPVFFPIFCHSDPQAPAVLISPSSQLYLLSSGNQMSSSSVSPSCTAFQKHSQGCQL